MSTMNAAIFSRFGDPAEVITYTQVERPQPGADQVLVKMLMSPIHNHDLLTVRGEYGVKPELPTIGGTEAAGTIAALGDKVSGIEIGTRVAVAGIAHSWAEYFIAPANAVVPVPAAIDDATAAQLLGMPMASVLALNQYDAKPGDWMLVNAANGAVGKVIGAAGRARGLKVGMIVRSPASREYLRGLGFEHVFATDEQGWKDALHAAIGKDRVAGGIDNIGGVATADMAQFVSDYGLILSFGALSNQPAQVDVADLIYKQMALRGYWSLVEFGKLSSDQLGQLVKEVMTLAASGQMVLPVDRVFPLSQSAEAMAESSRPHNGKVLIAA